MIENTEMRTSGQISDLHYASSTTPSNFHLLLRSGARFSSAPFHFPHPILIPYLPSHQSFANSRRIVHLQSYTHTPGNCTHGRQMLSLVNPRSDSGVRIPPQRVFDERLDISEVASQELFFHDGGGECDEADAPNRWQTGVSVPRQSFFNLEAIPRHHHFHHTALARGSPRFRRR